QRLAGARERLGVFVDDGDVVPVFGQALCERIADFAVAHNGDVQEKASSKRSNQCFCSGAAVSAPRSVCFAYVSAASRALRRQASAASASFVENGSAATAPTRPAYPIRASARNSAA